MQKNLLKNIGGDILTVRKEPAGGACMRAMTFQPMNNMPIGIPGSEKRNIHLPFFTLTIEENGNIHAFGGDYYDLTDTKLLEELISAVSEQDKQTGTLPKYDLRFLVSDKGETTTIIFADISNERAILNGLIRNCIIAGLIGYAVFFVISLRLAKWMTEPVEKTWNEQKQFIADASHELKEPLNKPRPTG